MLYSASRSVSFTTDDIKEKKKKREERAAMKLYI